MSVHPYLFFSGDCAMAFTRYQEVLGGELQIMTHADLPEGAEPMPGAEPHHVMHASLALSDGLLMGSDDPTGDGARRSASRSPTRRPTSKQPSRCSRPWPTAAR